ncbi:amidohydrolase 2 [Fusarium pseudocircinatum]|uniref:Amidohydrolase 2 n=1 Tax=Fusarium pseudocircinatum TaxID=56676 RepID=A0A8H5PEG0_9HYPO|nr:amidohydrolase 2 [Fusarium pseudocircinatum]
MDFSYADEIDASRYETHDLDHGIPLRMHRDSAKEVSGALRAQKDWTRYVRPVHGYKGGLADPFGFISVTIPECRPERLEIVSYANEFAFLYDDEMEMLELKRPTKDLDSFLQPFVTPALEADAQGRPEKRLQAQIFSEMMAIDHRRAITAMKTWASFVQLASRTRMSPFETLEEYIPARVIDAGELNRIWFGSLTFGMGLTIPDEEYDLCMSLARPGYAALGLTNDLYSWEKERKAAQDMGQDYVFNAIWVIMKESAIGEEEAKEVCRCMILQSIEQFRGIVVKTKNDESLSRDLRVYIEAVMWSYIGNLRTGGRETMSDNSTNMKGALESNIKYPFWFGGSASALVACVTHPLDLVKVRLQTSTVNVAPSFASAVKIIISDEGVLGLYSGLTASVVRQLIYSGIRFGIYEELKSKAGPAPSSHFLLATAWCSGFAGGVAGNFADVLNVRMQHDGSLPSQQRHNYRHVGDGMVQIVREEGIGAYMRGWLPNCTRAATQTAGQLASYDIIKKRILDYQKAEETPAVQATSAFLAAVIAVTVTNPLDVLKTRAMSSTATARTGMVATASEVFRIEGPAWIFRGWVPSFLRVGPHTMLMIFRAIGITQRRNMATQVLTKSTRAELFPNGGWDTHHHIFEPSTFSYSPTRHLTPPAATVQSFKTFRQKLGITNSVLTHGLSYGDDCTSLKTFVTQLGKSSTSGVGVIDPENTTDDEIRDMQAAGICGLRVNLYHYNAMEDVELQKKTLRAYLERVTRLSLPWSLTMTTIRTDFWDTLEPFVREEVAPTGRPLITDHFGLLKAPSMLPAQYRQEPTQQPGFAPILRLVKDGLLYVKLSAPYRVSEQSPRYSDLKFLVRALVDANPRQVIWGSDWPHTPRMKVRSHEEAMKETPFLEVDDEAWLWSLREWLSDQEWHMLMVDNPRRLFG